MAYPSQSIAYQKSLHTIRHIPWRDGLHSLYNAHYTFQPSRLCPIYLFPILMISLYLILLVIAPQIWVSPFIGLPVDFYLYPLWLGVIALKGKLDRLFAFQTQDFFFMAMIGWIIASSIVNPSNPQTNKIITDYIKFFILYRLTIASIDTFGQLQRVIFIMLGLAYVLVFESIQHKLSIDGIGWANQPLGWAVEEVIKTSGSGRTQWINIFDGPGVFCVIFTNVLPFVLQYLDKKKSFINKIFASIIAIPLLVAIYFTGSRGGAFATLAILFAYMATRTKPSPVKICIASIIVVSVFILAPTFLTSTSDSHGSAQQRVEMWKQGLEMTKYNPIFGVGKGNFMQYSGRLIAHNSAVEVMGETGLPGFFLWTTLIFLSLKRVFHFFKSTDDLPVQQSFAKALGICIIGYLASSMFVTLEYETFYFLLALAAALGRMNNVPFQYSQKDFTIVTTVIFGWICFLKVLFVIY